jgi:fused signal recognition particle receptor
MGLFNKIKTMFSKETKELEIYDKGLEKTRDDFVSKLNDLSKHHNNATDEYFLELEEILIMADIGVNTVMSFIDRLKQRVKKENITNTEILKEVIVDELFIRYVEDEVLSNKINYNQDGPTVMLFIGVNGVGKTTTIAKVANKLKIGRASCRERV